MKLAVVFFCLFILVGCKRKKIDSECCFHPPTQVVFDGGYLTVPNIFTPDGDGVYDVFVIQTEGLTSYHIEIKNHFGGVLYSSTDTTGIWDGTKESQKLKHGIFNYHITATGIDGTEINEEGEICVYSQYRGKCITNSQNCVFSSDWNGSAFVTTPTPDEFYPCP